MPCSVQLLKASRQAQVWDKGLSNAPPQQWDVQRLCPMSPAGMPPPGLPGGCDQDFCIPSPCMLTLHLPACLRWGWTAPERSLKWIFLTFPQKLCYSELSLGRNRLTPYPINLTVSALQFSSFYYSPSQLWRWKTISVQELFWCFLFCLGDGEWESVGMWL